MAGEAPPLGGLPGAPGDTPPPAAKPPAFAAPHPAPAAPPAAQGQPPVGPAAPQAPSPPPPPGPPPVTIDDVMELLHDDRLRGFRIDVETDQLIEADENADKAHRMEFVTAIGGLLQGAMQVMQGPAAKFLGPVVGETIMFAVRGFKAGRSLEDAFERAIEQMTGMQAPTPPPDLKGMADMKRLELDQQKHQDEMNVRMQELSARVQEMATNQNLKNQELAQNMAIKRDDMAQRNNLEQQKIATDAQNAEDDRSHDMAKHQTKLAHDREMAQMGHLNGMRAKRAEMMSQRSVGGPQMPPGAPQMGPDGQPMPAQGMPMGGDMDGDEAMAPMDEQIEAGPLTKLAENVEKLAAVVVQSIQKTDAALTAPKRVVRDEQGRVIGVETITPQTNDGAA